MLEWCTILQYIVYTIWESRFHGDCELCKERVHTTVIYSSAYFQSAAYPHKDLIEITTSLDH